MMRQTRDLLHQVLASAGARVRLAVSAVDALHMLQNDEPDVLVSDIGMSGMDGFELLRLVRQSTDPRISRLPALALTAFARLEDERRALDAGFDAFQRKPLEMAALLNCVRELPRRRAAVRRAVGT